MITSGYALAFGAGDFDVNYLARHLLAEVSVDRPRGVSWLDKVDNFLYLNVGVVARKP